MSRLILSDLPEDGSLFRVLVDNVQDYAIFALDATGHVASWNLGARRIKGYEAEEIVGRNFAVFFPGEDRAAAKPERMLRIARAEGRAINEGWRVRKDGTRFWASAAISALRSATGEVVGFAKVVRDLTELHESNEALRKRERQLTETQELAGLGSWEWSVLDDRVVWTDELYRIYGLDPRTFTGTFAAYLQLVHPDDRDRVRSEVERAYREGLPFEFEERVVRPDGEIRVLRSRGRAVRDGTTGRTTHLLGSCLDITELRHAQERAVELAREQSAREAAEAIADGLRFLVRASETLYATIDFHDALRHVAGLAATDFSEGCTFELIQPNGSTSRITAGVPPDEGGNGREGTPHTVRAPLPGQRASLGTVTLARTTRPFTDHDVWLVGQLGRHVGAALENARLNAELAARNRLLEEQSAELEAQTEELQAQITHNEELMAELEVANQELLVRTEEAEHANRAKAEFLAAMSHELRTPLNAIFGYADLIQLGVHGPVTPAQNEAIERIKRNQKALLLLINDVLNFAKLEAGGLSVSVAEVNVPAVLSTLEEVIGPQLRAGDLQYECHIARSGLRAMGDQERIQQVLLNLLTNAIKFTERRGRITVTADESDGQVRVCVRDTGCGIPADRLGIIFDPFVQVGRQSSVSGERGVGLGLAISRDLAEAMGGSLTVESAVGQGSTFTLSLRAPES